MAFEAPSLQRRTGRRDPLVQIRNWAANYRAQENDRASALRQPRLRRRGLSASAPPRRRALLRQRNATANTSNPTPKVPRAVGSETTAGSSTWGAAMLAPLGKCALLPQSGPPLPSQGPTILATLCFWSAIVRPLIASDGRAARAKLVVTRMMAARALNGRPNFLRILTLQIGDRCCQCRVRRLPATMSLETVIACEFRDVARTCPRSPRFNQIFVTNFNANIVPRILSQLIQ